MLLSVEHLCRRSHLHDLATIQHSHPIGHVTHDVQVMRNENEAYPRPLLQIGEQVQDRRLDGHIQCRGRLVTNHHARLAGQRARYGHTLLLPAG